MPLQLGGCVTLLQVFDMHTAVAFYRDILGFEIVHQSRPGDVFDWALLKLGDAEVMLNTMYESEARPPASWTLPAFVPMTIPASSLAVRMSTRPTNTSAKGVEVEPPKVAPYGMKQLWLHDPDGYGLCLQWPV